MLFLAGMIPSDEEYEHLQARMLFGMNNRIVEAMEIGGQSTAL